MTEKEFLRAVRRADRRFFAKAAARAADPQAFLTQQKAGGTRAMKQEKKKKRIWIPALAAAALLAVGGGAAAVVGMRGSSDLIEQKSTPDVTEEHGLFALTDHTDVPGMHGLAESENGYYFMEYVYPSGGGEGVQRLFYSDKETGTCVYFCNRANCLHDGDEFCTASTGSYDILTENPVWLDGYLYAIAEKTADHAIVLLRYEPDGSAITEVQEFYQAETGLKIHAQAEIIAHRGYLWYTVSRTVYYTESDPYFETGAAETRCDYRLGAYDVGVGKDTVLLTANEQKNWYSLANPFNLQGDGDYIYFAVWQSSWGEQNGLTSGIWRLSCVTGEKEQVIDLTVSPYYPYLIYGEKMFFEEVITDQGTETKYDLHLYDLTTKEILMTIKKGDLPEDASIACWTADAEHIVLLVQNWRLLEEDELPPEEERGKATYLSSEIKSELWIYDWDGNLQKVGIDSEAEFKQQPELYTGPVYLSSISANGSQNGGGLHISGDELYVRFRFGWYKLNIEDALNGNADLSPAFLWAIGNNDY